MFGGTISVPGFHSYRFGSSPSGHIRLKPSPVKMMTCAPGPCRWPFLYVATGNCEMWLFIEPLAIMKRMWPPPAPRSFASFSGRPTASATKLVLSSSPSRSSLSAK